MSCEFLEEFLKIYESEPCLWHVKNKEYHDRSKKEAAYLRLIEKLKEIEPNANKESVVKKINNIRSAYRKEIKKIKASIKSGAGTEDIYKPKLWYFELLRFLDDQDTPRSSRSNIDSDDDIDIGDNAMDNTTEENHSSDDIITPSIIATQDLIELSDDTPVQTRRSRPPKRSRVDQESLTNEVLLTVKDHFNKPHVQDDRFDIFGKNVAIKLRELPKQQMLIAEKLINETLFQAELGTLSLSHKLVYEQQHLPHQFFRYHPPISTGFGITSCPPSSTSVQIHHDNIN
ncbi:uncharacterized protein [Centruroides vittatus]|uniref:uncharacterized protein n=2 Tax=Centruroides vittatus TaxID=120091 RepID=UPI00350F0555